MVIDHSGSYQSKFEKRRLSVRKKSENKINLKLNLHDLNLQRRIDDAGKSANLDSKDPRKSI